MTSRGPSPKTRYAMCPSPLFAYFVSASMTDRPRSLWHDLVGIEDTRDHPVELRRVRDGIAEVGDRVAGHDLILRRALGAYPPSSDEDTGIPQNGVRDPITGDAIVVGE